MIEKTDVIELIEARKALAGAKEGTKAVLSAHSELFETERNAKARVADIEEILRAQALAEYLETKDKKLSFGLGIRVSSTLSYEVPRAMAFAKEKDMFLALDTKAFEAAAVALKLDWVDVITKITATIPKEVKIDE